MGYYVFLDCPGAYCAQDAARFAELLLSENSRFDFDGLIVDAYIGSDGIRPYAEKLDAADKALFVLVRTPNRSASELQDLLTGSRHVHMATADLVNRFAETSVGKSGYSRIASVMAANHPESLRSVRSKHKSVFLFVDGYDQTNANAKNCSYAFDPLGHGAVVCAGTSVTAAWKSNESDYRSFVPLAVEAAEHLLTLMK
jgi:orotidine-5'-phosphate decarboxylase